MASPNPHVLECPSLCPGWALLLLEAQELVLSQACVLSPPPCSSPPTSSTEGGVALPL